MAVKPAIGGDVAGDVEAAAAEIRHEHATPAQPGEQCGDAAGDDVLLVAMNHRRLSKRLPQARRERIAALAADVARAQNLDLETTHPRGALPVAERDQPRRHALGHVPGELEGIALRAADDAILGIERCRDDVRHAKVVERSAAHQDVVGSLSRFLDVSPLTAPATRLTSGRR
jgi:hypothetical protein